MLCAASQSAKPSGLLLPLLAEPHQRAGSPRSGTTGTAQWAPGGPKGIYRNSYLKHPTSPSIHTEARVIARLPSSDASALKGPKKLLGLE